MRLFHLVIVLGALLAAPTASALDQLDIAISDAPSEVDVAVPRQSLSVDGQEVGVDSEDHNALTPANVMGSAAVNDLHADVEGPSCKLGLDMIKSRDEAASRCHAGGVRTNAGLDLVEIGVQVDLGQDADAEESTEMESAAATGALLGMGTSGTMLFAAAAAGASMGALYGLWRLLKWTGFAALMPLYSHISDNEILDDPNRAAIYRLIQAEAGISTKDIADRLGLAWGTVTHHLTKLEKRRFVVSKKYGKYRRYFANGAGGTERKDEIAVLRLDRTGDIAQIIRERPGLTQKEVSDLLGVSSSTILWHVKRLEMVHLVRKVRDGKQVRYFPADGVAGAALIAPA